MYEIAVKIYDILFLGSRMVESWFDTTIAQTRAAHIKIVTPMTCFFAELKMPISTEPEISIVPVQFETTAPKMDMSSKIGLIIGCVLGSIVFIVFIILVGCCKSYQNLLIFVFVLQRMMIENWVESKSIAQSSESLFHILA